MVRQKSLFLLRVQDALWSSILVNPTEYIKLNQAALKEAYTFATDWLKTRQISYRPAHAGHFVLIDLREYLGLSSSENEEKQVAKEVELLNEFVEEGVYVGPGESRAVGSRAATGH